MFISCQLGEGEHWINKVLIKCLSVVSCIYDDDRVIMIHSEFSPMHNHYCCRLKFLLSDASRYTVTISRQLVRTTICISECNVLSETADDV